MYEEGSDENLVEIQLRNKFFQRAKITKAP